MYLAQCCCLKKNDGSGALTSGLGFVSIPGTMSLQKLNAFTLQLKAKNEEMDYLF